MSSSHLNNWRQSRCFSTVRNNEWDQLIYLHMQIMRRKKRRCLVASEESNGVLENNKPTASFVEQNISIYVDVRRVQFHDSQRNFSWTAEFVVKCAGRRPRFSARKLFESFQWIFLKKYWRTSGYCIDCPYVWRRKWGRCGYKTLHSSDVDMPTRIDATATVVVVQFPHEHWHSRTWESVSTTTYIIGFLLFNQRIHRLRYLPVNVGFNFRNFSS